MAEWLQSVGRRKRFFGCLAAVVLVACSLDFFSRVHVARDPDARKFSAPVVAAFPVDFAATLIKSRLTTALPEPRLAEEAEAPKPREVVLQGVFMSRGQRTAVVVLQPQGSLPLERRNVRVGDEVDGWIVETIEGTRLGFRKEAEVRELRILRGKVD